MTTALTSQARPFVEPAPFEYQRYDIWSKDNQPRKNNDEGLVAEILSRKKVEWFYEPYFYPLRFNPLTGMATFGFRPDFWLPATRRRPGLHIEVTRAGGEDQLGLKREKIRLTLERYQVETVLVDRTLCNQLRHNYKRLDDLIAEAVRRIESAAAKAPLVA